MGNGTDKSGTQVDQTYEAPGRHTVALTITDDSGVANAQSVDTLSVDIIAPHEPAIAIPDRPVSVSEAALLDGSQTTDADDIILSHVWDFGDEYIGEGSTVNYAWIAPASIPSPMTTAPHPPPNTPKPRSLSTPRPSRMEARSKRDRLGGVIRRHRSRDPDGTISCYEWRWGWLSCRRVAARSRLFPIRSLRGVTGRARRQRGASEH